MLRFKKKYVIIYKNAAVTELADVPDLGSGVFDVGVQVPSAAPYSKNPNSIPNGEGFGFLYNQSKVE